jgi:Predicted secreted Zn-dependent protease
MKTLPCLLALLLATLLAAGPSRAEVVVSTATEHYPVTGRTPKEIAENLKRQSPIKENGRTFQAHTRSNIRYEFSWTRKNGRCAMKKATINITVTYKYPELVDTPDTRTKQWWEAYLKRLEEHEQVHGAMAIDAARELDKTLNSLGELECSTVKDVVRALGEASLDAMRNRQRAYDAKTEHGLRQEEYKRH